MDVVGWVKQHPWSTGILVVGGGLTFIVLSGVLNKGSSSGVVVASSSGPTDAQLAASTNLQMAQISAGVASGQTQAELAIETLKAQISGNSDVLNYQLGVKQTDDGLSATLAQIQASLAGLFSNNATQLGLAGITAGVQTDNIDANKAVSIAQITSTSDITKAILDAFKPTAAPVAQAPAVSTGNVYDQFLVDHPDVVAAFSTYSNDQATWATSGFHTGDNIEQFAKDQATLNAPAYSDWIASHPSIVAA